MAPVAGTAYWHAAEVPDIDELLRGLEAPVPSPAGGTAAAIVGAMAASLVVMAGRESPAWLNGAKVAADAGRHRDRLLALGEEDVTAVAAVLRSPDTAALAHATDVPLEIAERAAAVAELAALAATEGKPPLRPDAKAAAILAEAATRAAAFIVRVNTSALAAGNETTKARLIEAAAAAQTRASAALR